MSVRPICLALAMLTVMGVAGCRFGAVTSGPAAAATSPGPIADSAAPRPNIVLILADDLGYADVSTYRAGRIPTPNIDRIGREGAVFTQGYATAPICSPSRAGLMTGRHQQRFGFEYNTGPAPRDLAERRGLDSAEWTLADALRSAGYRTAAIGKWHLGSAPERYPLSRGFDEFWGFLTGQSNHIAPDAPEAVNALPPASGPPYTDLVRPWPAVGAGNAIVTGPQRERVDLGNGYLPEQITEQALAFIERHRAQPFFLYLAHSTPHTPLQTTRKYFDRFGAIADRSQRVYAGMVSALDDAVGAVLDRLAALGIARNTIVVFVSDNGCAAYIPGLCGAEPLSGGKLTYLEGGVRIPFLVRWPARIAAGRIHQAPVSTLDLFPTLAAAAGIGLRSDRAYDGLDLLPQLQRAADTQRPPLFWRSQPMQAMRLGDWKYLKDLDGIESLYDLAADPTESRDLAATQPSVLADLRARYAGWQADKAAPKWSATRVVEYDFAGRHFRFTP